MMLPASDFTSPVEGVCLLSIAQGNNFHVLMFELTSGMPRLVSPKALQVWRDNPAQSDARFTFVFDMLTNPGW